MRLRKLREVMAGQQREAIPRCRSTPLVGLGLCATLAMLGMNSPNCGHADPEPEAARRAARRPLLIGSIELRPCPSAPAYCGRLERSLDPSGAVPGRISIYFEFYPHTGPDPSTGTLVATEGGPGYPATLSRDAYLALFKPLRQRRDLLLMDNRGTGQSGAIDCHELQTAEKWTVELNAACGTALGETAPLYSTAYAADDLAAILDALGIRRIDLYGDSYGTYFEQVFAIRHPNTLRSIVLDGAYPLEGPDYAWYPSYAPAMRDKFNIACRRFAPCARLPGSSIDHIQPLIDVLRLHPFPARGADSDGRERDFTANASQLAIVMYGGAPAFATVRELDAAARAFARGDRAPVLRLMAETVSAVDSRDPSDDAAKYSAGLAAAVMCQDPPQIFDMRLPPELRTAERDRAVAARKLSAANTYAPFTIDEYRGMPLDYSFIDQCVEWPVSSFGHPASHVVAADPHYPDIPALIISGELDNITTPADGAAVAKAFKHGTQVLIANSFHVNALPHARSACGAQIARRFIAALDAGDTSCAARVPPLRLTPLFAAHASELEPAAALPGNRGGTAELQLASAAVMTVGDVLARVGANSSGRGVGLRGGIFHIVADSSAVHVTLDKVRWTEDLAVSGRIDEPLRRTGTVRATLELVDSDRRSGVFHIEWPEGVAGSRAAIRGTLNGISVLARTPAP
jgi:pimeloyl-ACP methyl ester carboxylesterase